jgi:hypothetical protein
VALTRKEITRRYRERHKDRLKAHPFPSQTKEATREYMRRYRAINPGKVEAALAVQRTNRNSIDGKAKQRAYYTKCQTKPAHRMQRLITKARGRAIGKGLDFSESLFAQMKSNPPTECECCGGAFDYGLNVGHNKLSASFDRIDNSKGYVWGNVAAICRRCNRIKADASLNEIEAIAKYMRRCLGVQRCA